MEVLESRNCPAVISLLPDGTLLGVGDGGDDIMTAQVVSGFYVQLKIRGVDDGSYTEEYFPLDQVNRILLLGRGGEDVMVSTFPGQNVLLGGAGNDVLVGSIGQDTMLGQEGNDVMIGGKGNDVLMGGGENDFIEAGAGADRCFGEAGNDSIASGKDSQVDWVSAGTGQDFIIAEKKDVCWVTADDRLQQV